MPALKSKHCLPVQALMGLLLAVFTCPFALGDPLTIPAEQARIKTAGGKIAGAKAEGGWNLWTNGEIGDFIEVPAGGSYTIVVRAYGSPAKGGWPLMGVAIDARQIATATVDKNESSDYSFTAKLSAGIHRITVSFTNDLTVPDPNDPKKNIEDRNLYLGRIEIRPPADGKTPTLASPEDWAKEVTKMEARIMEQADRQIEKHRKADAVIRVVDAAGKPVAGAKVTANLVRHQFLFGCNIYMFDRFKTPAQNEQYKQRFAELFNFATTGFYWKGYEPKCGQPNYPYTDKVVAWCLEHGISMKGHPLLWGHEAGIPTWSNGQPDAQTRKQRVTEILRRYSSKITFWEVVNEPAHIDLPRIDDPYRWAREADPKACLIVNDYHVLADGCPALLELLKKAQADKVPFDGIGIQAHEPRTMRFPLDQVKEILDRYAALGKDLYITEFTPTSAGEPITGSPVSGKWDEQAQEDYAVKLYRVCFAHPAVKGITWWDLSDEGSWLPGGGMLRKDLSPKQAYNSLKKLIHQDWHTQVRGRTDGQGQFAFRGFIGEYEVTATADGKTAKSRFTVQVAGRNGEVVKSVTLMP